MDGSIAPLYRGQRLLFREWSVRPVPKPVVVSLQASYPVDTRPDHPWRKALAGESSRAAAYREDGLRLRLGADLPINKGTLLSS